ncbi:helix-hairpin-helix domain-containing protein [Nocardia sp. NPDC004151]|uniref:helix-hairpin-helix domain-containing protein n=1 Tax=Nocardia sp. NPDC004151 TaxID=3364304 RepID=UPI003692DB97
MPQLDERTPLQRLTDRPDSEPHPSPTEFTPGRPHPSRWDEDSLDDLRDPDSAPPAWLSEPCGPVSLWHERLVPERFRGTRWDPGPRGVLVLAALALFAVLFAAYISLRETPVSQPVPPIASLSGPAPADQDSPPTEPAAPGADASASPRPGAAVPGAAGPARPLPGAGAPVPAEARPSTGPQADRNPVVPTANPGGIAGPAELVVSVIGLVEHGGLRRFPTGARVADALRAATPRPEADLSTLNLAQPLIDGDQIVIARAAPRPTAARAVSTIVNSAGPQSGSPSAPGPPRSTAPAAKVNLNTATEPELDTLPGVGPVTAKAILTWRARHGRFTSVDQLAEIDGIGHSRLNRLRDRVTV